ncbi:unnamed protein product [Cylicocyclus nassatus]|uniref:Uncharacterized protein n=1 Tax=Cylicocyclus nassatus TaxID=53992 RepID=A0AA36MAU0_CYLNA|nr:unnamed protein product [Cylicocyclus nassatus]
MGFEKIRFLAKKYNLDPIRVLTEARSIDAGHHDVMDRLDHPLVYPVLVTRTVLRFFDGGTPGSTGRGRSFGQGGNDLCVQSRTERRECVARLAVNVAKRGLSSTPRNHRVRLSSRQSFDLDVTESERGSSPPTGFGLSPQPQLEDNLLKVINAQKLLKAAARTALTIKSTSRSALASSFTTGPAAGSDVRVFDLTEDGLG